jgi:hypothetical protein
VLVVSDDAQPIGAGGLRCSGLQSRARVLRLSIRFRIPEVVSVPVLNRPVLVSSDSCLWFYVPAWDAQNPDLDVDGRAKQMRVYRIGSNLQAPLTTRNSVVSTRPFSSAAPGATRLVRSTTFPDLRGRTREPHLSSGRMARMGTCITQPKLLRFAAARVEAGSSRHLAAMPGDGNWEVPAHGRSRATRLPRAGAAALLRRCARGCSGSGRGKRPEADRA